MKVRNIIVQIKRNSITKQKQTKKCKITKKVYSTATSQEVD